MSAPATPGTVNLSEVQGQTDLTLDDRGDATPRQVTLDTFMRNATTWGSVQGLGVPTFDFVAASTASLTVKGGGSAPLDSLVVNHTPGGSAINFSGIQAADVLGTAAGQRLTLSGTASPMASLTVDFSTGGIASGTVINADTTAAQIIGASATDPFTVSNGVAQITHLGATVELNATDLRSIGVQDGTYNVADPVSSASLAVGPAADVVFHAAAQFESLSIDAASAVTAAPTSAGAAPNPITVIGAFSVAGKLDLINNALVWHYSGADPVAQVRSWVRSGITGGSGIGSSASDAAHGLAVADAADGTVQLSPGTLEVHLAWFGDVNLDGTVGFPDLLLLAQNYGRTNMNWDQGDLNYDAEVNFPDLLVLAQNYGEAAPSNGASVGSGPPTPGELRRRLVARAQGNFGFSGPRHGPFSPGANRGDRRRDPATGSAPRRRSPRVRFDRIARQGETAGLCRVPGADALNDHFQFEQPAPFCPNLRPLDHAVPYDGVQWTELIDPERAPKRDERTVPSTPPGSPR